MNHQLAYNTGTTIAGSLVGMKAGQLIGRAIGSPIAGTIIGGAGSFAGGYVGNLFFNPSDALAVDKRISERAIEKLVSASMTPEAAKAAVEAAPHEQLSNGFLRNTGNVLSTNICGSGGSLAGMLTTTALMTLGGKGLDAMLGGGNALASYGFSAGMLIGPWIGRFGGSYIGNHAFANPSENSANRAGDMLAEKILAESPPGTVITSPSVKEPLVDRDLHGERAI